MIASQRTQSSTPAPAVALCNGCLTLIDAEWEPVVRIDQYSFHERCAPRCYLCGGALERDEAGVATTCVVVRSQVEFVRTRGYQVKLTVCCCSDCFERSAQQQDPSALD